MPERKQFREKCEHGEILAIKPEAFDLFYGETSPPAECEPDENGVAKVTVEGPLEHHAGWWFDSYDAILTRVELALANDETRALIMCFDSPGGDASGMTETHKKIRRLRKQYDKPIYGYSNESAFSAAYGLASACDEIWLPETGGVGSVGVIATVVDRMKANQMHGMNVKLITTGARKADGHPDRPLTDDVEAAVQARVNQLGEVFFKIVARSRGLSTDYVKALEAGVFLGKTAVEVALADGVASYDKFHDMVTEVALRAGNQVDAVA